MHSLHVNFQNITFECAYVIVIAVAITSVQVDGPRRSCPRRLESYAGGDVCAPTFTCGPNAG